MTKHGFGEDHSLGKLINPTHSRKGEPKWISIKVQHHKWASEPQRLTSMWWRFINPEGDKPWKSSPKASSCWGECAWAIFSAENQHWRGTSDSNHLLILVWCFVKWTWSPLRSSYRDWLQSKCTLVLQVKSPKIILEEPMALGLHRWWGRHNHSHSFLLVGTYGHDLKVPLIKIP